MKKVINTLKNQRGLTLIELLAVVVILGIIAAIAVPSVGKIISNTKEDAKVAEALQIINAAKIAQANDSTKTSWVYDAEDTDKTNGELKEYLNSVKDTSFTVTFDATSGDYSIKGHDSASIVKSSYTETTVVPESELTAKAQ
ncbi:type IV pilin protein [Niallia nealsonii]|nr:type II secretion system protein [Niallia nealsonii]